MINIFAYTRSANSSIVRLELSQQVQLDLAEFLNSQVANFESRSDVVSFDGRYHPDETEVLEIKDFDGADTLIAAVTAPLDVPVADAGTLDLNEVRALFFGTRSGHGKAAVYIQHFDRRRVISSNGFSIFLSKGVFKRIEGAGLTLDNRLVAKVAGKRLTFVSFFHLRQIFDMSSYYRDATDADIETFVDSGLVQVEDMKKLIAISSGPIRRKFWLVKQSRVLEEVKPKDLQLAAKEFGITLTYKRVKGVELLELPLERRKLKELLQFLDDDYLKSPLSKKSFLTNSKRPIA